MPYSSHLDRTRKLQDCAKTVRGRIVDKRVREHEPQLSDEELHETSRRCCLKLTDRGRRRFP
jgi:hypothetical protein